MHPYKHQEVQALEDVDEANSMTFCHKLLNVIDVNEDFRTTLVSDETPFNLSGYVNKQNFRYWANLTKCIRNHYTVLIRCMVCNSALSNNQSVYTSLRSKMGILLPIRQSNMSECLTNFCLIKYQRNLKSSKHVISTGWGEPVTGLGLIDQWMQLSVCFQNSLSSDMATFRGPRNCQIWYHEIFSSGDIWRVRCPSSWNIETLKENIRR